MRKIDVMILVAGALAAITWVIFSGKDGFKGSDATIVARSIAISATIDGQVENNPPAVGAYVDSNELLARIHNGRIDRSRLIEFESQIDYLQTEIANIREQQEALEVLQDSFKRRAASYSAWMLSDLKLKHAEFTAELDVAKARKRLEYEEVERARAKAETARINSSFAEEHRAPFTGMVNARYVTQGTRVTSGTNLLQILDCTHPAVIIPIPDNRISEFSVGLKVTVYPIDSEEALPGKISYISSGPMIGSDTSIQIHQEITLDGNRAIVSLDEDLASGESQQACETARKAVVLIHTKSIFDTISAMI